MSRDLRPLFNPRSVAVLGASNDRAKWGHWLARGALKGEHRRSVFLVNRNGGEILGHPVYRSLAELPAEPELVVVSIPAAGFEDAVEASLAAGARALIGISAGLGEAGADGRARERAVVEKVRAAGAVLIGPNCLGIFDAESELDLSSNEVPAGSIGFVSQSGNLALEVGLLAQDVGLGFSRFVSLGNQADIEAAELISDLAAHEPTEVIGVYCEDFRDGREFARTAERAVRAGKPVIVLAGGATDLSARAAHSHTGALVSEIVAVDAACRAAGIVRVSTPKELVDAAQALRVREVARGQRVAIAADGGGHTVIAADLAAEQRLELPLLSDDTRARLAALLPPTAATSNPVDFAGGGEVDIGNFARVADLLLSSDQVDIALLTGYFGGYSEYATEFVEDEVAAAEGMARAVAETGKPLVAHTMYWQSRPALALREHGIPVYREVEAAVGAVARLARRASLAPRGVPDLPKPASPPLADADYWSARELLAAAGVPFVPARPAATADEALAAAEEIGYPVVLKAFGPVHKSDAGGVALSIDDGDALQRALSHMETQLSPKAYSVEQMAPLATGVELIVGARRDVRFGPVTLVGLGGVHAELLGDVAVALAPVTEEEAGELMRSLRGARLLTGARGRRPLDLNAAARATAALSRVAAARPEIADVEVNPLLVTEHGALGLDARIVLRREGDADAA